MTKLAEKWAKSCFQVDCHIDGVRHKVNVKGYTNGPFGIDNFKHRSYVRWSVDNFVLNHLSTGFIIGCFPSLKLAKLCAAEIAPRHAWERVKQGPKISKKWRQTQVIIRLTEIGMA
jgi:hypothetical protein